MPVSQPASEPVSEPTPSVFAVLIVDDSEADQVSYQRYLEKAGEGRFNILSCELGEEALQLCKNQTPDIILLDYLLPDTDGIEFLKDLMAQQASNFPSVIMVTGEGNEQVAVEAMKYGAKDYLVKGNLTAEKLVTSIKKASNESRLQRQIQRQRQQRELLLSIALRISHTTELSDILQETVEGACTILNCDRTLVYRFAPDMSGTIVAESLLSGWTATLDLCVEDNCFTGKKKDQLEKYLHGYRMAITDVEQSHLTPCHIRMLQGFQVKANLVVPILLKPEGPTSQIWGLLIAHHCLEIHEWTGDELSLMDELAVQVAIAIQQAELVANLKAAIEEQQAIERQLRLRASELEYSNLQLSQATQLLLQRNQELDEFSYIASHDLKAPLRGILNLSSWLIEDLEDKLPAENKEQLELIQSRILQMNELIDGLLKYAQAGRKDLEILTINVRDLVREVVEFLAPSPGLHIELPQVSMILETPVLLLKQVLSNLIGNAIKYHDKTDGEIKISVEEQETFLEFTVCDNGPGIDPQFHQKIFGIFQTLSSNQNSAGTGIGLAIIKKIIESQGGSVQIQSEVGSGSTFTFTWPKTT